MSTVKLGRLARGIDVSERPYVQAGVLWFAGIPKTTVSAANGFNWTINNPVGSGRNLSITDIHIGSTPNPVFYDLHLNPTTGLPTTALTIRNAIIGSTAYSGAMQFKADVAAPLTGGTELGITVMGGGGMSTSIHVPIVIPPGTMLGGHTLAAVNLDIALTFFFVEE